MKNGSPRRIALELPLLLMLPLSPSLLAGCPTDGDPKGSGPGSPVREFYRIVATTLSDTCFGETGSTIGGTYDYVIFFEQTDEGFSVLLDADLDLLVCEGDDTAFTCTLEDTPETTTFPATRDYTLEGTRDRQSLSATLTAEIACEGGTTGCTPCGSVVEIEGTWYEE